MSKRLSAIFGLSKDKDKDKDKEPSTPGHSRQASAVSPVVSPVGHGRLQKHRLPSTSHLSLDTDVPPLEPPPTFRETASGISSRASSRPVSRNGGGADSPESSRSRPQTPTLLAVPGAVPFPSTPTTPGSAQGRLAKKKSWIPPSKQDKHKFGDADSQHRAWIAGLREHIPYDLTPLLVGGKLPELWDENGDVLVHLYPESSGRGPNFRVHSSLFADSKSLNYLAFGAMSVSLQNLELNQEQTFEQPSEREEYYHSSDPSVPSIMSPVTQLQRVYLPLDLENDYSSETVLPTGDDLELIVLYRNFFAFLGGGALISTPRQVSLFSIFLGIASILRRLDYSNADGSTWGDIADSSFARYCEELRLADVRSSREKTIEAVVLGENMKHWRLYNEGFVHAAGRLDDIKSIKSPKFAKISPVTVNRLERASLDVESRLQLLNSRLSDFEFPSIFAGIANSQTSTEAKLIRFKAWRLAFIDMRKFVLAQYKRRYGAWPPKGGSKKNHFDQGGLNRALVKEMEEDFNNLYDMLANPLEMTTRTIDMMPMTEEAGMNDTIQHALRSMESEFDRSTPPVIPPIPFDTPLIPSLDKSFKGATVLAANSGFTKFKANELNELLLGSYNRQYVTPSPFVQEFMAYERRLAAGATLDQIIDNRCGQWLFIYAVLQSLPMTAVDARDVRFTEGCEYFLFSAPRGGKPWMREDTLTSRAWYNVKSAGATVSLSADVLDHAPEGIYRRSHCWLIAEQWLADAGVIPPPQQQPVEDQFSEPYQQPCSNYSPTQSAYPTHFSPTQSRPMTPVDGPRASPLPRSASHTNLHVTMEEVAAPAAAPRPASQYNPSITFDSILGANELGTGKSEKKKKK